MICSIMYRLTRRVASSSACVITFNLSSPTSRNSRFRKSSCSISRNTVKIRTIPNSPRGFRNDAARSRRYRISLGGVSTICTETGPPC